MLVTLCVTENILYKTTQIFFNFIMLGWYIARPRPANNQSRIDANDESLRKWKESLGLGTGKDLSDPKDPRTCIILSLGLEV